MMRAHRYREEDAQSWNAFVRESRNATFLFDRGFMDYHADRFEDASLVFEAKDKPVALLPVSRHRSGTEWRSHGGLTYGGLLLGQKATILDVLDIFALIAETARNEGVESLLYKPVPSVYHRYPSEEDRHALFQAGAVLETSALDSVVDLSAPLPQSALRRRGARKAEAAGITAFRREDPSAFHAMLSANLAERHGVDPVHSVDEMRLLAGRFADNIALWTAESGDGALLAGAWLFKCGPCVHVQYIATTPAGRELGALDLLLSHLMTVYSASARYFSFGVSNEGDGRAVNRGLFRQKTMFGGRGIVYEGYRLSFT